MLSQFVYSRDLVRTLLSKELKLRYKSSFLGYGWSLLHPLALALVYFYVFKTVMRTQQADFGLFLIAGLFPWTWMANGINASVFAFLSNASLIKKVVFPRWLLVLVVVYNEAIHFLISIPVIILFVMWHGRTVSPAWLWQIPVMWLVTGVMILGVGLIVATANLFFRDLERLVGIFLMMMMFGTPIMYSTDFIPPSYRWTLDLNPFAWVVLGWRGIFYNAGDLPWEYLWRATLGGLLVFLIGYSVYRWKVWRFAEIV